MHRVDTLQNTKQIIRDTIHEVCQGADDGSLTDDSMLFAGGILDSTLAVDLVFSLEERFKLSFADSELTPEHFASIKAIAALVLSKTVI